MAAPAAVLKAFDAAHRALGETITYRAGDVAIEDVSAIPGKSTAEIYDQSGLATIVELQDFAIRADALVVPDGSGTRRIRPERGHIIEVIRDGQTHQFRVQHPDMSQAPFRNADAYGGVLRIHTTESEAPTAAE